MYYSILLETLEMFLISRFTYLPVAYHFLVLNNIAPPPSQLSDLFFPFAGTHPRIPGLLPFAGWL